MDASEASLERRLRDLEERAKELRCLYAVDALLGDPDISLEQLLEGIVAVMPAAWQYPAACGARIECGGITRTSPGYIESAWKQSAPIRVRGARIGTAEVVYRDERPTRDEGPFLKEERKLLDTIAERVGHFVAHRRLLEAAREQGLPPRSVTDWSVILDLLGRTDRALLARITRKMINHLRFSGIREADGLFEPFAGRPRDPLPEDETGENQPTRRIVPVAEEALVRRVFELASARLGDDEIVARIHDWIRENRAAFLLDVVENSRSSLAELSDAVSRYQQMTRGESELPPSTAKGLKASLVRRVLGSQHEYLNVAKEFVELGDFQPLLQRTIYPEGGHGRIGGKGAGLFLAERILRRHAGNEALLGSVRTPRTWYITSDGLHDFMKYNNLEDVFTHKYRDIESIRREYPDIIATFKQSSFSPHMRRGISLALDDLAERPLIVRSSSLLEDRFGASFAGKYKSLFVANQGGKSERLEALTDAIAEVYASTFGPDPIEYRAERGLLDASEGMGILIQEVVGRRMGDYFLPTFAGVAVSRNEFRWSPRIGRDDGLMRLVPGLGTRAVDRVGDDYPILVSPGQPGLRVNTSAEETTRYAPRWIDVINVRTGRFETLEIAELLRRVGGEFRNIEQIVSIHEAGRLRIPMMGEVDFARDDVVATCEGLLSRTPLLRTIGVMLELLKREWGAPVDLEFAHDGEALHLLQCRTQNPGRQFQPAAIPRDLPCDRVIFSARRHVSDGTIDGITHVVYVDPDAYARVASHDELIAVGRAVGRLNQLLPKRRFILIGPGRWGSRGDIKLGVRVTYADINNTAMLVEVARDNGPHAPDLSFGTHFFQDLVESSIRYLPLYPGQEGVEFNEAFLTRSPNVLPELAPEFTELAELIRVIDVRRVADDQVLHVLMNADLDEAVAVLGPPGRAPEASMLHVTASQPSADHWRWRRHMAERIAASIDVAASGVVAMYLFGSTENGNAGPASDIDLIVHFRGSDSQRSDLETWLAGWSRCLAEINFLRTGYSADGLLDVHIVTDEDISARTSYASKIGAVTDAARPLALGSPKAVVAGSPDSTAGPV